MGKSNSAYVINFRVMFCVWITGQHGQSWPKVPAVTHDGHEQYSAAASSFGHVGAEIKVVGDLAVEEAFDREDACRAEEDDGRGTVLLPAEAKDGGKVAHPAH